MIFAADKSHGVAEQPLHIGLPLGLQARRTGQRRETASADRRRRGLPSRQSSRNSRANSVQTFSIVSSTQTSNSRRSPGERS